MIRLSRAYSPKCKLPRAALLGVAENWHAERNLGALIKAVSQSSFLFDATATTYTFSAPGADGHAASLETVSPSRHSVLTRISLPPLVNQTLNLLKSTSLASLLITSLLLRTTVVRLFEAAHLPGLAR